MSEPSTQPQDVIARLTELRSEITGRNARAKEQLRGLQQRAGALHQNAPSRQADVAAADFCQTVVDWLQENVDWMSAVVVWLNGQWWLFGAQSWAINEITSDITTIQGWQRWVQANCTLVDIIYDIVVAVEAIIAFVEWVISLF
jgi:hypothetical protein